MQNEDDMEEYNARGQKTSDDGSAAMFAKSQKSSSKFQQNDKGGASAYINSCGANSINQDKAKRDAKKRYKCGYCHKKGHKESEC